MSDEGHWLDISVHRVLYRRLARWGRQMGLTPEGMAKIFIVQGAHQLRAQQQIAQPKRLADSQGTKTKSHDAQAAERDRALFEQMVQALGGAQSDLLPAPSDVQAWGRTYATDAFPWPEGGPRPRAAWIAILADGQLALPSDAAFSS